MKSAFATLTLVLLVAGSARAQNMWSPEIGIQGGYARFEPTGTGTTDHVDFFDLPGQASIGGLVTYGNLFVIIPWKPKLSVEPSIAASQVFFGNALTTARIGLRLNYAFTRKIYAAAGGVVMYLNDDGQNSTNLGVQLGLGYRWRFTPTLNGRVEAHLASVNGTDEFDPSNSYALLIGLSTRLDRRPAAPARRAGPARAWQPALGVAGGYTATHVVNDGGDLTGLALPGIGGSLTTTVAPVAQPPTMFVILPVGSKLAMETGIDLHRAQDSDPHETRFSGNLGVRLDYAVTGGWYAAAGPNLNFIQVTGEESFGIAGATVAWGYRFGLAGNLGGRVELNYLMMAKQETFGIEPQNTFGVLFGLTMRLK